MATTNTLTSLRVVSPTPLTLFSHRKQVHRQMAYGSRARVATGARSCPRLRSEFFKPSHLSFGND